MKRQLDYKLEYKGMSKEDYDIEYKKLEQNQKERKNLKKRKRENESIEINNNAMEFTIETEGSTDSEVQDILSTLSNYFLNLKIIRIPN